MERDQKWLLGELKDYLFKIKNDDSTKDFIDGYQASIQDLESLLELRPNEINNTYEEMYGEVCKERDGWIAEYRAARREIERLKSELYDDGKGANHTDPEAGRESGWSV